MTLARNAGSDNLPCSFVIFGATGNLASNKLLPALYHLEVAARLAEEYYRPVALVSLENGRGRGSARSIEGFHLYQGLHACRAALHKYGGHQAAAGFEILPPTPGGATRQDSVRLGLESLAELRPDRVLIHDGARPFVDGAVSAAPTDLNRPDFTGHIDGRIDVTRDTSITEQLRLRVVGRLP